MGKFFAELNIEHCNFIQAQRLFFVGTAPLTGGNVNVSPKGYDTIKILNNHTIIYADYNGSGNETAFHLLENQRITFMWCSFEQVPLILRVYGKGAVIQKDTETFSNYLSEHFPNLESRIIRQLFIVDIKSIQSSCGYGVPIMEYKEERITLEMSSIKKYT